MRLVPKVFAAVLAAAASVQATGGEPGSPRPRQDALIRVGDAAPSASFRAAVSRLAGTGGTVRFEPGDEKAVELVPFGGLRSVYGFNDLVDSWTGDAHTRAINIAKADALGFKNVRH